MRKKSFGITFCMIVFTIFFTITSCKKDDSNNSNLIIGKWNFDKLVTWKTFNGSTSKDTIEFTGFGLYADFRTDGKEYSSYFNGSGISYDTTTYSVSNNHIFYTSNNGQKDTVEIKTLNNTTLVTYFKEYNTFYGDVEKWGFHSK